VISVLSLFSGIGGLDLGLEATGRFRVIAQSEIDPYACRVLKKHWPNVPNLGDITKITEEDLEQIGPVDVICGGFPCQDLSNAGKQDGINASRSGLYFELMRVVRLVRPKYILLENVPALLSRAQWMGAVLGELASSGYDAKWDCVPASASVGAPHRRDRVFIVADTNRTGCPQRRGTIAVQAQLAAAECSGEAEDVADATISHPARPHDLRSWPTQPRGSGRGIGAGGWLPEPDVGRVADGVSNRVDRLRGLGNAVVPQVAAVVAGWILEMEDQK